MAHTRKGSIITSNFVAGRNRFLRCLLPIYCHICNDNVFALITLFLRNKSAFNGLCYWLVVGRDKAR